MQFKFKDISSYKSAWYSCSMLLCSHMFQLSAEDDNGDMKLTCSREPFEDLRHPLESCYHVIKIAAVHR